LIPSLFFTASIQHAMDLSAVLRGHGVRVYPLSGKTPDIERKKLIRLMREGAIDGLASCDVISTGFDCPIAMGAFMSKSTKSGLWYRQAIGRVLRPYPAPQGKREYQSEALRAIARSVKNGIINQLLVLPTGTGKTTVTAKLPAVMKWWKGDKLRGRILFLVHRDELVMQTADTFRLHNPDIRIGVEKADSYAAPDSELVIGSAQTLGPEKDRRLKTFNPHRFDAVITDECFVPGTLVDGRPIESLSVGDLALCADHSKGQITKRPITGVSRTKTAQLVRVTINGRATMCTPSHPYFSVERDDYVPASSLRCGSIVLCCMDDTNASSMHQLRRSSADGYDLPNTKAQEDRQSVLLRCMSERLHANGGDKGQIGGEEAGCVPQDENQQSNERPAGQSQDVHHTARYGMETSDPGRERYWPLCGPASTSIGLRMGYGSDLANQPTENKPSEVTFPLQIGHSEYHATDSGGGGWVFPLLVESAISGQEKRGFLALGRVDRIEILESGGNGEFERVCPEGFVYNLEVEDHHNYFANGTLVHNCHFGTKSAIYERIYRHFHVLKGDGERDPEILHLGMTATPARADGIGLEKHYDEIVYVYDLRKAIEDKWLTRIVAHRCETSVDISKVSVSSDDFRSEDLAQAINTPARNELIAQKYLEVCGLEGMTEPLSNIGLWQKPHAVVVDFADLSARHSLISAATLFGLRSKFDAKGKDLVEQVEKIEKIEQEYPTLNLREAPDMAAIHATLQSVDLLAAPAVPPEVGKCSKFGWLADGPGAYHLGLMDHKVLTVRENTLGQWEVYEHSRGVVNHLWTAKTLKEALALAEKQIPLRDAPVLRVGAKWQGDPPTEPQANRIWQIDARVRKYYKTVDEFFGFCVKQYQSGNERYSRGGLSRTIGALGQRA